MFTIRTKHTSNASGRGQVIAKGHGRQRTVSWDHSRSSDANHALATGALLNVLADERQQAILRHPSGGQRVQWEHNDDGSIKWTVNV